MSAGGTMIDLNSIGASLLQMGLPGIVIIALGWFILELRKDLKAKDDKIDALQEARNAESREGLTALNANTNILDDLVKAVQQGKVG